MHLLVAHQVAGIFICVDVRTRNGEWVHRPGRMFRCGCLCGLAPVACENPPGDQRHIHLKMGLRANYVGATKRRFALLEPASVPLLKARLQLQSLARVRQNRVVLIAHKFRTRHSIHLMVGPFVESMHALARVDTFHTGREPHLGRCVFCYEFFPWKGTRFVGQPLLHRRRYIIRP
jgi:hypothetical protein